MDVRAPHAGRHTVFHVKRARVSLRSSRHPPVGSSAFGSGRGRRVGTERNGSLVARRPGLALSAGWTEDAKTSSASCLRLGAEGRACCCSGAVRIPLTPDAWARQAGSRRRRPAYSHDTGGRLGSGWTQGTALRGPDPAVCCSDERRGGGTRSPRCLPGTPPTRASGTRVHDTPSRDADSVPEGCKRDVVSPVVKCATTRRGRSVGGLHRGASPDSLGFWFTELSPRGTVP